MPPTGKRQLNRGSAPYCVASGIVSKIDERGQCWVVFATRVGYRTRRFLVLEMALVSEDDGSGAGVGQVDGLFVFQRASRMDNTGHSSVEKQFRSIGEWEKGIAAGDGTGGAAGGLGDRQTRGRRTVHLAGANADQHLILCQYDRVAFYVLADQPGETEIG